jgi:hypothetical protein
MRDTGPRIPLYAVDVLPHIGRGRVRVRADLGILTRISYPCAAQPEGEACWDTLGCAQQ